LIRELRIMRQYNFVGVVLGITLLGGCSGNAAMQAQPKGLIIAPASSMSSPILLKQPNQTVTLTAAEAGYAGACSATIITGEHCVDLTPVAGESNQFTVTRVIGCNDVRIDILDDVGHSASAHLVTQ
jgi:hypothetical protein